MSATAPPLLVIEDLHVSYGHVQAVRGISLEVRAGQVVTLVGRNGAGKSSTLGAVAGLIPPAAGRVLFEGEDVTGIPAHEAVERGIVLVPEGRSILARMSIEENLVLAAEAPTPRPSAAEQRSRIEAQYARFPVLGERRRLPAGSLSGGEQQMLAFARALLMRPRILLLDEPSMGLAPLLVRRVFDLVEEIHREGATVLLVEQNARLALRVSSHGYVLERGRVVVAGPSPHLAIDPRVQAAYLGGDVTT